MITIRWYSPRQLGSTQEGASFLLEVARCAGSVLLEAIMSSIMVMALNQKWWWCWRRWTNREILEEQIAPVILDIEQQPKDQDKKHSTDEIRCLILYEGEEDDATNIKFIKHIIFFHPQYFSCWSPHLVRMTKNILLLRNNHHHHHHHLDQILITWWRWQQPSHYQAIVFHPSSSPSSPLKGSTVIFPLKDGQKNWPNCT